MSLRFFWPLALLGFSACGEPIRLVDADGDGWFANDPDPSRVDCDDNDPTVYPGAPEVCDGKDNNCDGRVDVNARDAREFWPDRDGDGFGVRDPDRITGCEPPPGYSPNRRDCDDTDPTIYPGAPERCDGRDNNCNGRIDEGFDLTVQWYHDRDGDGYGRQRANVGCRLEPTWVDNNDDCDDSNAAVFPGAREICNGIDDNCSGLIDDADPLLDDGNVWWVDADGDGYGDILREVQACGPAQGRSDNPDDCDDTNPLINPETIWYRDADWDGFGDPNVTYPTPQCTAPIGYVLNADDCDDTDPRAWATARWYADNDGDTFGAGAVLSEGCDYNPIHVTDNTDCDDTNPDVFPGAPEVCNGIDDNCSGLIDDDDPALVNPTVWYIDEDGDGWGVFYQITRQCAQPEGFADNRDDCNDRDPEIGPGQTWYRDADRDGFGDPNDECGTGCGIFRGCVPNADDCDDTDFDQRPDATWYVDNDGDGVGVGEPVATGCVEDRTGLAPIPGDCDDDDPTVDQPFCVGPGFAEVVLSVTVGADGADGVATLTCGELPALAVPLSSEDADTSFSLTVEQAVPTGTLCELDADAVTGAASFDAFACDEPFLSVSAGTIDADTADLRCNGCDDPSAINIDPDAVLITNATSCLYPR